MVRFELLTILYLHLSLHISPLSNGREWSLISRCLAVATTQQLCSIGAPQITIQNRIDRLGFGLSGLLTWHYPFQLRLLFLLESVEKLDSAINTGIVAVAYTSASSKSRLISQEYVKDKWELTVSSQDW